MFKKNFFMNDFEKMENFNAIVFVKDVKRCSLSNIIRQLSKKTSSIDAFTAIPASDGKPELRRVTQGDSATCFNKEKSTTFVLVNTNKRACELMFAGLINDTTGNKFDLSISIIWSAVGPRKFLETYALERTSQNIPLTNQIVESWIADVIQASIDNTTLGKLRLKKTIWWEKHLKELFNKYGLSIKINLIKWLSEDVERAEAEKEYIKNLKHLEEQQKADLKRAEAEREYKTIKEQIETDEIISSKERQQKLQLLELRHRKELIEAELELELTSIKHKKLILEQKSNLTEKHALQEQVNTEIQCKFMEERLHRLSKVLDRLSDLPGHVIQQLSSSDMVNAHMAAEKLVSPEYNVVPEDLLALGYNVTPQMLIKLFQKKAKNDIQKIFLKKNNLHECNIGIAKVNGISINSHLRFEFTTERNGYVMMLNIGTSGSIYLHIPNAYSTTKESQVFAGGYKIPGSKLLSWQQLYKNNLDYVERGPLGWEHIALVVSNKILIPSSIIERSTCDNPFVKLTSKEIKMIFETLSNLDDESWSAGVLSFLVE